MDVAVNATSGAPQVGDGGEGSEEVDNSTAPAVNSTVNITSGYVFTNIWTADFENETMNITSILAKLNETLTIVGEVQTWFVNFFGPSGICTLNITEPTVIVNEVPADNSTASGAPA